MPKLTKTYIDKIQPPSSGYEVYWDDSVRGYGLRVSPPREPGKPARKVFFVMGRVRGKSIQFTIGAFGTYTEYKARKRAQSILQDMREGIDPRDAKKVSEQAGQILRAVADGKVDPETGKTLIGCLHAVSDIKATEELEQRIIVLEMRQVA